MLLKDTDFTYIARFVYFMHIMYNSVVVVVVVVVRNVSLCGTSPFCIQLQVINNSNTPILLFIPYYRSNILKITTCFGLYFLRPSSGRNYPYIKETVQCISYHICNS